jgi:hypothetical protein
MESQSGLSTDQKWVTIAPCLFEFLKVSFNPGYNAAPWNTFERQITSVVDGRYTVNEQYPLVFFHFSNFDHRDPQYKNKRASNEINESYDILERLGTEYSLRLRAREAEVGKPSYSFDYMSDGSYISPTLRRAYACMRDAFPVGHDPFDASGAVGRFARKNSLVSSGRDGKYIYPGVKEAAKHGRTLAAIYVLMRLFLRVFGPNRFYDLSKLMVYLSSYRLHRRLWRL